MCALHANRGINGWMDLPISLFFSQESPLSATAFMVAVDQEVMMDNLKSFTDALVGMLMCFYVFNMHYPVELVATMEFLQR